MMGQVFIEARYTLTAALLIAALLAWYWLRLGRETVPESRRRVRRLSLFFMLLSLPAFVRGLSYLSPRQNPSDFVITWTVATVMLLLVIGTALADAVVSLRLHRREFEGEIEKAGTELRNAVRRQKSDPPASPEGPGDTEP
jgi:ABC-type molybdate transport system permease subunit